MLCSLEPVNGNFSPHLTARFENLSRDDIFEMKYISKNTSPVIVQLFENGVLFQDRPSRISESTKNTIFKAYISERISPSNFYIVRNNDVEEALKSALEFPLLEDSDVCVGKVCVALWEETFYRAEILAVDEQGKLSFSYILYRVKYSKYPT